ncbi:hypothetical protein HDC90_001106 [Pedobacter sp. AK013]|uniref:hypothetical protein n=1 Tax=Pedobacter sp. AK013 TaxID=2723071 RepID=UPI0016118BF1|nr:hypothetical protein [Pedobacter sp. AK013]MBB6236494.1 hypothetical protein [Pedobacter sp. AK013]
MAALITTIIPQAGFEKVRDAIGVILLEELTNQKELSVGTSREITEDIKVYLERTLPISEEENLYFNVLLDGATYGNFTQKDAQGRTVFYIDVYTTGQNSSLKEGGRDSAQRLHKFIGIVRYIFSDTRYKMLNLPVGLIGGTYIEAFVTPDVERSEDNSYTRFGRLTLAVRISEEQTLWDGVNMVGADAKVLLSDTDKGYLYQYN